MIDMPRILPEYVYWERQKGRNPKLVFRRNKGKRTPMPADPTSKEFKLLYARCLEVEFGEAPTKLGTLKWLSEEYFKGGDFNKLAINTQKNYRSQIMKSVTKNPDVDVSMITKEAILKAMDTLTPQMANNYKKSMRSMFIWACRLGLVDSNPTDSIKKIKYETKTPPAWTDGDLTQYRSYWPVGSRERLVMEIIYHGGFALADTCRLSKAHVKGGMIIIARQKTGVNQHVPIGNLAEHLVHAGEFVYILNRNGNPFTANKLGNFFRKARKAASLPEHCEAHALRRKRAIDYAENGATALEMMPVFGWTQESEATRYTSRVDKQKLAKAGSEKLG